MKHALLIAALAVALTACGSRLNPINWFRTAPEAETLEPFEILQPEDGRPLVSEVTSLTIERTPGGAIVRATGLPPAQGWYDAELVSEDVDEEPVDGVLTYTFRARPPLDPTRVSTVQSRELSAAVYLSDITLARTSTIRVTGETNARVARR